MNPKEQIAELLQVAERQVKSSIVPLRKTVEILEELIKAISLLLGEVDKLSKRIEGLEKRKYYNNYNLK